MKKWLILFVIVDFVFVGLVLKLSTENQRNVAAFDDPFYKDLTEGQKNKYDFVQSLKFSMDTENLTLTTDRLQALCQLASTIELKFVAGSVAYAGGHPTITHTYSCANIKKNLSTSSLQTPIKSFVAIQKEKKINLGESEMQASLVYSDDEFPADWALTELVVTGEESNFTVTAAELDKVHTDHRFEFNVVTFFETTDNFDGPITAIRHK